MAEVKVTVTGRAACFCRGFAALGLVFGFDSKQPNAAGV